MASLIRSGAALTMSPASGSSSSRAGSSALMAAVSAVWRAVSVRVRSSYSSAYRARMRGAVGLGGGVGRVGGGLQLGDQGAVGGVDPGQLLAQMPGSLSVAGGLSGAVGGQGGGQHGLAVRLQEPLGDERGHGLTDGLLAHRDAGMIRVLGGQPRVGRVVGAHVVGVGAALPVALGDAVHAALAGVAADPGAQRVAAAGLGGGHSPASRVFTSAHLDWLTVVRLPGYAPELKPAEGAWANMKNGLGNLAASTVDQLAAIMGNRLRRIQHRPALISGFLAQTGLTLEPGPRRGQTSAFNLF